VSYIVDQCGPTIGPLAACGLPQRFHWPAEANLKIYCKLF